MSKRKRRKIDPPWTPFLDVTAMQTRDFMQRCNADEVLVNSRYQVLLKWVEPEDGSEPVIWLSIKRRDRKVIRDWRELQRIKNEICGPEREAIEIFPAESRLVDTSNQFHLWVMPKGFRFPFGFNERLVMDSNIKDPVLAPAAEQRPFEPGTKPDDIIDTQEKYDAVLADFLGDRNKIAREE